jgi:hypothetical protein
MALMKHWLSYTIGVNNTLPIYDGGSGLEPCAVEWNPSIYCNSASKELGGWYDELSLPQVNYQEIVVESMRAYHLLCRRDELRDWEGVVRVVPPVPVAAPVKNGEVVTVIVGSQDEYAVAGSIAREFCGRVFLCAAVGAGCRIVSSDAGAAEEYLTRYGVPGAWHVVRHRKKDHFIGAVNDLYGVGNWMQLPYCDEVPYG